MGQDNRAEEEARADPPKLVQLVRFDRTLQVRSTPWRLSGVRVRLVDCTDPRLRGREGVVQGWEQESGRIRVQVQSEVVHVWPGELVRIQEQEEQSGGERKRRTLEEPDTAAARAMDEVKRARYRRGREPGHSYPCHTPAARPRTQMTQSDSVTSAELRGNQRGGRRGVLSVVASGLTVALRGIWKWAISRTSGGTPWREKRKKDRRGDG